MTLPRLYAVVDEQTASRHGWRVPDLARTYLAGGARLLQIRVTAAGSGQFLAWCDEVVDTARSYDAQVIVNNRVDIAILADAGGVHVGQEDLPVTTVRQLLVDTALVGLSTHTSSQVERSVDAAVSYVAVGPVYQTATKNTGYSAVGLDLVRDAAGHRPPRPIVAIGGITLERVRSVIEAGASAVAVVSDLLVGDDPEGRVRDYVTTLDSLAK